VVSVLALHGCGLMTIVARQFFYGIRGTRQGLNAGRVLSERTTCFDSLVTFLVLVTAQTRVIYANHPMPQEEWFRGKL
jgi:hypothetical protein